MSNTITRTSIVPTIAPITMSQIKAAFPGVSNATNLLSYSNVHPTINQYRATNNKVSIIPFSNLTAMSPSLNLNSVPAGGTFSNCTVSLSNSGILLSSTLTGVSSVNPAIASVNLNNYLLNPSYQDPYNNNNVRYTLDTTPTGVTLATNGALSMNVSQSFAKRTSTLTVTNFWNNSLTFPLGFSFDVSAPSRVGTIPAFNLTNPNAYSAIVNLYDYFTGTQPLTYSISSAPRAGSALYPSPSNISINPSLTSDAPVTFVVAASNTVGVATQSIVLNQPPYVQYKINSVYVHKIPDQSFTFTLSNYFASLGQSKLTFKLLSGQTSGLVLTNTSTDPLGIVGVSNLTGSNIQTVATVSATNAYNQSNVASVNILAYPFSFMVPVTSSPVYTYNLAESLSNTVLTYDFSWKFMSYNTTFTDIYVPLSSVNPWVLNAGNTTGVLSTVTVSNVVYDQVYKMQFYLTYRETGFNDNITILGFSNCDVNGFSTLQLTGLPTAISPQPAPLQINANTFSSYNVDMSKYFVASTVTSYSFISYSPSGPSTTIPTFNGSIMTLQTANLQYYYKLKIWGNNNMGSTEVAIQVFQFTQAPTLTFTSSGSYGSYLANRLIYIPMMPPSGYLLNIDNIYDISHATISNATIQPLLAFPGNIIDVGDNGGAQTTELLPSQSVNTKSGYNLYSPYNPTYIPQWTVILYNTVIEKTKYTLYFSASNIIGTTYASIPITTTSNVLL